MRKQIVNKELLLSLPNEVKAMKLPPKANEIYCYLFAFADKEGMCYSTIEGLSKELNCSKTTVMSNLKLLENKKLIIERVIGKIGVATRFKIKLFDGNGNESCNNGNLSNENDDTNCNNSTNDNTDNNTELKKFIEEVITLKFNEFEGLITKRIESMKIGKNTNFGAMYNLASNANCKQVGAFKDGKLVMTFPSTKEAKRNGFDQSAVSACCRNCYSREGNNVYKGFEWRYI